MSYTTPATAPLAIPASITAAAAFLVRPLVGNCAPVRLTALHALLRRNLTLAFASAAASSSTNSRISSPSATTTLTLSFAPNRVPPAPVAAAAHAARVPWAEWMALLARREFELRIAQREVRVAYQGLHPATVCVWAGEGTPVVVVSPPAEARGQGEEEEERAVVPISKLALRRTVEAALARREMRDVDAVGMQPRAICVPPAPMPMALLLARPQPISQPQSIFPPQAKAQAQPNPKTYLQPPTQPHTLSETRPRTLAQQLLDATHEADAEELFARLARATTAGVLSPTPTRDAFPPLLPARMGRDGGMRVRWGAPRVLMEEEKEEEKEKEEQDLNSPPSRASSRASTSSLSSTLSSTGSTASTAPSERSASTAASSVESVVFVLDPAPKRSAPLPAAFIPRQVCAGRPVPLPKQLGVPIYTPAPRFAASARSLTSTAPFTVPIPVYCTPPVYRAPRTQLTVSSTTAPKASSKVLTPTTIAPHAAPTSTPQATRYLYQGGVSTVLGGGVMLGGGAGSASGSASVRGSASAPVHKVRAASANVDANANANNNAMRSWRRGVIGRA